MKLEIAIFRLISAFGIVWFHSEISRAKEIAYGGLIFFIIISVNFAVISERPHGIFERAQRLLVPCCVWAIFYGAINIIFTGRLFPEGYSLFSSILSTPAIHLWFLPFIFFVLIVIDGIRPTLRNELINSLVGVSAIILILLSPIWREFNYIRPLGQYAQALPAVLIGIFLSPYNKSKAWILLLLGILATLIYMAAKQQPGIGIAYLAGTIPCYFLFSSREITKHKSYILFASSASLGVYLVHPFFLKVFRNLGIEGSWLAITAFILSLTIKIGRAHV